MNILKRIVRFFRPPAHRASYRVFIEIGDTQEVLGEYRDVTREELSEQTNLDQAGYVWKKFMLDAEAGRQPEAVFAQLTVEEI